MLFPTALGKSLICQVLLFILCWSTSSIGNKNPDLELDLDSEIVNQLGLQTNSSKN